mmetsp:Transcript_14967/g.20931  ORF Transcript_14967/g.20931 Transcript_14967/m.20931 type:complete len:457 (-) Transcript_14967:32-1402(-)
MFIQALLNPETDHPSQANAQLRSHEFVESQQNVQITKSSNSTPVNSQPEVPTPTNTIHETQSHNTNNNSRSQRSKKMPMEDKTEKCPVCDMYLSPATIQEHIQQELSKLHEAPSVENVNVRARRGAAMHARKKVQSQIHLLKESRSEDDHEEVEISNNREILNSVRKRRQTRQRVTEAPPSKKRSSSSQASHPIKQACFLCGEALVGDDEDINAHIDQCLKSQEARSTSTASNAATSSPRKSSRQKKAKKHVVEQEEQVETYVWCDETRVRSCSVVGEGYAELVNADRMKKGDESAELDVMDDDVEAQYGAPQYSEADLIRIDENEDESDRTLRKRVSDNFQNHTNSNNNNGAVNNRQYSNTQHVEEVKLTIQTTDSPQSTPLVEALKAKIVELQKLALNSYKCLVCLEQYQVPLVSIQCWHVYCEKCWLSALGSKKLCPQCKTITTPNDLRKIFL